MKTLPFFSVYLTMLILSINSNFAFGFYESIDSEVFDSKTLEFAKDISSIIIESTLTSKCEGNVIVVTKKCEDYIVHAIKSLSDLGNPVTVVSFKDYDHMSPEEKHSWNFFLSWKRRPCSQIFICDLVESLDKSIIGKNDSDIEVFESDPELDNPEKLGYANFARFFTSQDKILYFSDPSTKPFSVLEELADRERENEAMILKQTGIILSIRVTNRSEDPESVMQVYSRCDFCGPIQRRQEINLGNWQRNKTQFGKFLKVFDNYSKITFNNSDLNIGYFNYPPHFFCSTDMKNNMKRTTCSGIEWEMISQIAKSLQFNFTLKHIGINSNYTESNDKVQSPANFSGMVEALKDDSIDLAAGGISVTSERIAMVDFSKVFANEPIVFVVKKPKNIFILGIWLAFQPSVWPLIFLLITVISFLFGVIINRKTLPSPELNMTKLSMSIYLDPNNKILNKKPIYVKIFESLEITLQPLLSQPLNPSQISSNPRRLLKMMLVIWWFSCLVITTLYNTSLITSLINPVTAKEPESLQNLIDAGYRFKLGGTQGSVYELILSATDLEQDEQKLFPDSDANHMKSEEDDKRIKLLKTIRERLIIGDSENYRLMAYIIEESAIQGVTTTWSSQEIGFSEYTIIRERLFLTGYGFALKPQAAFREKINTALARLGAGGLIDHWYHWFILKEKKAEESKYRLRAKLGQIHLDLQILQGAFIFLIFGCFFALLVFGLEHVTKRYNFRFFSKTEIFGFLKSLGIWVLSFYRNHLAQKPLIQKKKNKNKFRTLANTVVAVPSRTDVKEYQALKEEMDQLIGRINGRFSKPNWSPIRYIYGCISQEQLAAFYRDASVALVTPLRDGMNLVAKEFVACQDLSDPGVLMLSPFAGAGGMMQEALIVNPYELEDVADKLHRALQMPFDERLLRMKQLQRREKAMDVNNWLNIFLRAMGLLPCDLNNNPANNKMAPLSIDDFDYYLSDYVDVDENDKSKLSLILDYDGTLAPIAQKPELAQMPEETRNVLRRLTQYSRDVSICIISGRSLTNLRETIGIKGLTYAACHGLEILSPDGTNYKHPITSEHEERIIHLVQALQREVCRDGAWVENKGALLTFHYREVPRQLRDAYIVRATEIFLEHGFQPHKAPMALEAKPEVKWDRGRASIHILRTTYGSDWTDRVRVIYCGDDASDEEAIQSLSGIACTFKVQSTTSARTGANYRLRSPEEVLLMLQWIEKKLSDRRSPSPTSPTRPNRVSLSFSFDETSDDEIRRIRTNSRGRTQNIFRRSKKHLSRESLDGSDGMRKSGETSPETPPSPPTTAEVFNRYL